MLIVSQDKKTITEKMELSIERLMTPNYEVIVWLDTRNYKVLGEYATVERAKEVLQEIIDEYKTYVHIQGGQLATSNHYVQPFSFMPPKVYSMPEK